MSITQTLPAKAGATQLKRYTIDPGRWDEYMVVWRKIAVLRQRAGFDILFACEDRVSNLFTWAIRHDDFAAGAARYYADPERKAVSRTDYDPATGAYSDDLSRAGPGTVEEYVLDAEISFVEPVMVA